MNIIDSKTLLTPKERNLLQSFATKDFFLGGFSSLDDILTKLAVDVHIVSGTKTRVVPTFFSEALDYWQGKAGWIEVHIKKAKNESEKELLEKELYKVFGIIQFLQGLMSVWSSMRLRGLYDSERNIIELYPEEMVTEYGGTRMNELLVSTLAHETMHAYFDRDGHSGLPYVPTVEEPLAEFGMLLYLKETGNSYYDWAYKDVKKKHTCYKYGANLMDQHLGESSPFPTRQFLEEYKILMEDYPVLTLEGGEVTILSPKKSGLGVDKTPIGRWKTGKKTLSPIAPPPLPYPSTVKPSSSDVVRDPILCDFIKKVFIYLEDKRIIDILANYIDPKTTSGPKITLFCDSEKRKFKLSGILYVVRDREYDSEFDSERWFTDRVFSIKGVQYYLSNQWNGPEKGSLRFSQFVKMIKSVYPGLFEIKYVMTEL